MNDAWTEEDDLPLTAVLEKSKEIDRYRREKECKEIYKLDKILSANGMRRSPVSKDGNCLFSCVAAQTNVRSEALRGLCCKHIKENEEHYAPFLFGKEITFVEEAIEKPGR